MLSQLDTAEDQMVIQAGRRLAAEVYESFERGQQLSSSLSALVSQGGYNITSAATSTSAADWESLRRHMTAELEKTNDVYGLFFASAAGPSAYAQRGAAVSTATDGLSITSSVSSSHGYSSHPWFTAEMGKTKPTPREQGETTWSLASNGLASPSGSAVLTLVVSHAVYSPSSSSPVGVVGAEVS